MRHRLHAITNAQHRYAQLKHRLRRLVGAVFVNAGMAAREDDALELAVSRIGTHPVVGHITGVDLAKDMGFTNAPGNQLSDLRTEVKDDDFLMHYSAR